MTATPVFAQVPRNAPAQVSAANTNRDGTGTVVTVLTAGSNGTRIDRITIKSTVTTTAGMVRLFIYDGSAYKLWKEVVVSAITVAAGVAGFESTLVSSAPALPLLLLPSGYSLRASTHNAEAINVIAEGGDF